MSEAEKFITEHTMNGSNQIINGNYGTIISHFNHWLTPDQARKAVEIAREEMISKLRKWVSSKNERDSFTFGYIDRHFDELLKEVMKDE